MVAVHGAGLANAVFMAEGKHVIELTLPEPHAHYYSHMVCTPNNPPKARATPCIDAGSVSYGLAA